ncbi:hypothetical protein [Paracoccus sp. ME4]|uniref:hypothetical protein n=1 Tax=Paracoccus sp. ME4 TaxID=3138066 RepID=UPI00398ABD9B
MSIIDQRWAEAGRIWNEQQFDLRVEAVNGWETDGFDRMSRTCFMDVGADTTEAMVYAINFIPGTADLSGDPEFAEPDWQGPEPEETAVFGYSINLDERGQFYADVRDTEGNSIFEIKTPEEGGDPGFEDLGMRHKDDLSGLRDHLVSLGVLERDAELLPLAEFERRIEPEDDSLGMGM